MYVAIDVRIRYIETHRWFLIFRYNVIIDVLETSMISHHYKIDLV